LDVLRAYREGKASGIDFIIGFPGNETQIWRSVIGNQPYQELIASAVADLRNQTNGPVADAIREAVGTETSAENYPDAESKIVERWNALGIYRSAFHLNEGGNQVHLLLWNAKPLIEKLRISNYTTKYRIFQGKSKKIDNFYR
jgi:para-nitrobenzyl esterase